MNVISSVNSEPSAAWRRESHRAVEARARRHADRGRRLRRRVRRAAARPGGRDDRQPRELHALHADPPGGGLRHARAAARRRPAPADVPARRAPARPGRPRSTRSGASSEVETPEAGTFDVEYEQLVVALGAVDAHVPGPRPRRARARLQGSRRRDPPAQPRPAGARGRRRSARPRSAARRTSAFVFVGAGYAGVEALAELADLVRDALRFYPRLRGVPQRWVLVDAAPKILPEIPTRLGDYAARELARRGVEIRVDTTLDVDLGARGRALERRAHPDAHARLDGRREGEPAARRASGCRSTSAAASASTRSCASRAASASGRSATARPCRTRATPEPVDPPTCQHALRQARRLAKNLHRRPQAYGYRMLGQVATLGRYKGIADVLGLRLRGFPGWFVTRSYHLLQLPL